MKVEYRGSLISQDSSAYSLGNEMAESLDIWTGGEDIHVEDLPDRIQKMRQAEKAFDVEFKVDNKNTTNK